ncbi:hypothetical protein OG741_18580 [Streptomyces sp. NBC_01410]|uniref:hypothetical protein n=1 Tax=Streptomyces sp. NBC_01410 TaxID=2903856 RepID=UPI00324F34C4
MSAKSVAARKTDLAALVASLASMAGRSVGPEVVRFEALRMAAIKEKRARRTSKSHETQSSSWLGKSVEKCTDPYLLEVHRPIQMEGAPTDVTNYIERGHDLALRSALTGEGPQLIVLVGESSSGKTRAAYEAAKRMTGWLLHHPLYPRKTEALIRATSTGQLRPKSIVWLNELQDYLLPSDGEQAAAAIREFLSSDIDVKLIGTIWPRYWQELTKADGVYPQSKALLTNQATRIEIEPIFPRDSLRAAASSDPRLRAALASSPERVTQYIAAGPALLEFFRDSRDCSPETWAILCSAMDAYTVGRPKSVSEGFLIDSAPGYLTDEEWGALEDDWFAKAIERATAQLRGAARPLSRLRPRVKSDRSVIFQLADYLVQHAQEERSQSPVPRSFWAAVVDNVEDFSELATFARAADERGMHKCAADLWDPLAALGDPEALAALMSNPSLDPEAAEKSANGYIGVVSLSDTAQLGWLLMDLHDHPPQKARLVKRMASSTSSLQIGPPLEMAAIIRELCEAEELEAVQTYSETIRRSLDAVDTSDFWSTNELIDALVESLTEGTHETALEVARLQFGRHDMGPEHLAAFLTQVQFLGGELANKVRQDLREVIHQVDITKAISIHPTIQNLFLAGEAELANEILTRISSSISTLVVDSSYAPLELLQTLTKRGYEEASAELAMRIAMEYDPGLAHSSVVALGYLDRNHFDEAFNMMATRLAESGPVLPLEGAEDLKMFYTAKNLLELCDIYSNRVHNFRSLEGS